VKQLLTIALLATCVGCTSLKHRTFSDEAGAIRGYDTVAYFEAGKPVKGAPDIAYKYNGATWHFASTENLELFKQNPEYYGPQYGGYCAFAMSKGFIASIDPQAWAIRNDKLYLNYSLGVRETWLKDADVYIEKADKHWAKKLKHGIDK